MDARSLRVAAALVVITLATIFSHPAHAAPLTPAQKKELAAIRADLVRTHIPIKRDLIEEAETKTADAEQRLEAVVKEAGLAETDSHVAPLRKLITGRREAIEKAKQKEAKDSQKKGKGTAESGAKENTSKRERPAKKGAAKISFAADVAPIFVKHCLGCHASDAKGGLRLDTFAAMKRGGKSGILLVPGDPENSLIMMRLTGTGEARMPKDADPISETECLKIAGWIARGAKFDGGDEAKPLDKLSIAAASFVRRKGSLKIVVARPTGDETVSFKKDIAPFMVERCLRCHSGKDPKGGLSLETFEALMAGGNSGPVVVPGNLDRSRMWDLVGKQRPIKMPPGDARITRTHWNSLQTWIREGAKFDGDDPKSPLKSLVPTEVEKRNAELAQSTPQELRGRRRTRAEDLWRRALPKEARQHVENEAFLVYGNIPLERLEEIARWAEHGVKAAQNFIDSHASPAFPGGLTVFVVKDRFSYEEFCQVVERREPQTAIHGHAVVSVNLEDAYIVVENLADSTGEEAPNPRTNLVEQVAAAVLMRSDKKLPDWLALGGGRVVSLSSGNRAAAAIGWPRVNRLAGSLEKHEDLFNDGTFSPSAARDVGAALVQFLIDKRGKGRFTRFVKSLQNGAAQSGAVRDVYDSDLRGMAEMFLARAAQLAKQATN
jgi:hypothetical protein